MSRGRPLRRQVRYLLVLGSTRFALLGTLAALAFNSRFAVFIMEVEWISSRLEWKSVFQCKRESAMLDAMTRCHFWDFFRGGFSGIH